MEETKFAVHAFKTDDELARAILVSAALGNALWSAYGSFAYGSSANGIMEEIKAPGLIANAFSGIFQKQFCL